MTAESYKVLGQSAPAATTLTDVYTVPASKDCIISGIHLNNRGSAIQLWRVAIRPAGAAIANQHYIVTDIPVSPGQPVVVGAGVTLATTDVITVYNGTDALGSVSVFGDERTP